MRLYCGENGGVIALVGPGTASTGRGAAMRDVMNDVERWLAEGKRIALATVVARKGSAPRGVGATLAVTEEMEVSGSVSGGCVEPAVIEEGLRAIRTGQAEAAEIWHQRGAERRAHRPLLRRRDRGLRRAPGRRANEPACAAQRHPARARGRHRRARHGVGRPVLCHYGRRGWGALRHRRRDAQDGDDQAGERATRRWRITRRSTCDQRWGRGARLLRRLACRSQRSSSLALATSLSPSRNLRVCLATTSPL